MDGAAQAAQGAAQGGPMPQGGMSPGGGFPGGPPGGGPGGMGFLPGGPIASMVILALFAITLIVLAIAFYRLFQKAGFAGALGLLMLVPVVNLGVALYLAFAEWPVLAELTRVKLLAASAPSSSPAGGVTAPPPSAELGGSLGT
jgi:hypothetical protein